MPLSRRSRLPLVLALVLTLGAGGAALARVVARASATLLNGRVLTPQGRLTTVGHFPTGAAATPDGRFHWTVSTLRDFKGVQIMSVQSGGVVQTIGLDDATGGIAMDPRRRRAYVATSRAIQTFVYARGSGIARRIGSIRLRTPFPAPEAWPTPWPLKLAVSADGRRLLAPLSLADAAAIVDLRTGRVRYVAAGSHPHAAAITRDGRVGLVSNEGAGTVAAIGLARGARIGEIAVGSGRSHPEGIAIDPRADRAYVALANSDQVVVIDTRRLRIERTLSVARPAGIGASPVSVTVTPDGAYLLAAEAGADELAVLATPTARRPGFRLVGRIPVAGYPTAVEAVPVARPGCPRPAAQLAAARRGVAKRQPPGSAARCALLLWTAARGLGAGPNPYGPSPYRTDRFNGENVPRTLSLGVTGTLDFPTEARIRAMTALASRQVVPGNAESPPAGTPLRADGPIRHVFYVVRENRTYDQVLGDMPAGDGDPNLTLFGRAITPNAHALAERFGLLDHVLANSDVSADGHYWTAAAKVSDYLQRNIGSYGAAADGGRPGDTFLAVSWPANGFLFDQAERQGISYFNFGETLPNVLDLSDADRTAADDEARRRRLVHSDLGAPDGCYPSLAGITYNARTRNAVSDSSPPPGAPPHTESRFDCFKKRFSEQLATGTVPSLTYMVLPMDHTDGLAPGRRTPRAMVAENDYALGQVVDLISHSPLWGSSAIFVVEDDSQNGADHVDAHRVPALAISPYARAGGVVHTRYDLPSMIRSMELILGMSPLGLLDALATPMYDAFGPSPSNAAPYDVTVPAYDFFETNPKVGVAARHWHRYDVQQIDRVPQQELDAALWKSVHGLGSKPPPPGPNAEPGG